MLKLKNVSKYYYQDGVIATGFTKVNLDLNLGEFVVITGESGSGKSTLLNVLSGLDSYEDGEMYINGEETSHYTEEDYLKYRRSYVSNIFQNFNLVNSYTVYENIELTMLMNGKSKKEIKPVVDDLINKVGLKKYYHTKVSKLSGGQKQRVAIARALANDTPIIVCDEPTGALDSASSSSILKLLHEVSTGKLVIVVTHNKKEIEKYATRLIKMHDGKILENKVIKKIDLDTDLKVNQASDITRWNKFKLGFRNAFNLPIKFLLMFAIFLLIISTLITNYGSFKISENEEVTTAYSRFFTDESDKRIIINKKDKKPITEEEYAKINSFANVDYVIKNDLINDYEISMYNNNVFFDGYVTKRRFNKVDYGALPTNDNEVVVIGNKENYYFQEDIEDILKGTYEINDGIFSKRVKVVGIIYDNNLSSFGYEFLFTDKVKEELSESIYKYYYKKTIKLKDNYLSNDYDLNILVSNKLNKGEAYIDDISCNASCLNNIVNINTSNIYENNNKDVKIVKIIDRSNSENLTGYDYDELGNVIIVSASDYKELFSFKNYQSSVYVKEIKDLDKVVKDLEEMGLSTLKIRDAKVNEAELILNIFKIFRLFIMFVLIFTLFFISYFIMKIIYKSRNSYFATLRTLGSTKNVCVNILMQELITLATFTYLVFLGFTMLVKNNIIKYSYLKEITKYIGLKEYLLVYLILILLSLLMALRYGRKIFKNSIIKTYEERL